MTATVGAPLRIQVQAKGLIGIECVSADPLAAAIKHPLTTETLEKQLGRLGGTGFVLGELTAQISGSPMVPLSVLGQLRHDMVAQLTAAREDALHPPRQLSPEPVLPAMRNEITPPPLERAEAELIVLCRSLTQLRSMLEHGQRRLVVDFADIREYRPAVRSARDGGASIYLATPRIQKPGEIGIFHALARHQADGILVRNLAGLDFFTNRDVPCVTDYSLNAANELTVAYLREQGALRITASYDLNRDQLIDMARHSRVDLLEVVIHQHMPMFHMEHCVFCSVLSPGTNKTNCGRPCDIHRVQLRDRVGSLHTLTADVGCRNTLFNGTPQSGAEAVDQLLRLGVRTFRVEFLDEEDPARLRRCVELYRDLIAGRITGREVWTTLQAVNRTGVTRGTLEQRRDPLAII